MKDDKKVPQLRFPEFTDAWKQRKLCEFVNFYSGLTYKPEDVNQIGTFVLRSSNVKNGEILDADNVYVNEDIAKSEKVQLGDIIVVVRNGSRDLIGKHATVKRSMPNTVIGAFMTGIRAKEYSFVNALLDTNQFEKEINKNLGATINQITGYMFSNMSFTIPSEEEQHKIGSFFTQLDNTITLQQRKLNSLQKLKKGLLQKMFPKNGENIPEIRFPEFSDAWKQRKVGDLLVERREMVTEDNEYPLMAFIANEGVAPKGDRFDRSALVKNADSKKYKRTKYGDFIYSSNNLESGSIGLNKYGKASISPVYSIFYPTNLADSDFIGRYFLRKDFIGQMIRWRQGVVYGQWKIPEADFLNIDIYIPSKDEQEKIGQILDKVDNTITLQQRKLEFLQKLKKGLLQQMFI